MLTTPKPGFFPSTSLLVALRLGVSLRWCRSPPLSLLSLSLFRLCYCLLVFKAVFVSVSSSVSSVLLFVRRCRCRWCCCRCCRCCCHCCCLFAVATVVLLSLLRCRVVVAVALSLSCCCLSVCRSWGRTKLRRGRFYLVHGVCPCTTQDCSVLFCCCCRNKKKR